MKINEFRKAIEKNNIDSFLLYNPINIFYFTKFLTQSLARLIVTVDKTPILYVPELEYEEAISTAQNCEVKEISSQTTALEKIKECFKEFKIKTCGIEENIITKKEFEDLNKVLDIEFSNQEEIISVLRSIKTNKELKFLRESAKIADIGMEKAIESIEPGKSELEIAALAEYEMRKNGSEPIPFDTIIATGIRSAFPHAKSTNHKIKNGDLIILDMGAKYNGYASDTSRTIIVGKPSKKQKEIYNLVLKSQTTTESKCHAGLRADELDSIAREIIKNKDYGKFFNHSLGHGVGLDVHERPTISFRNKNELVINNVITIEPGIYIPALGGVRIEDTVIVKNNDCEVLNKVEKLEF